MDNSGYSVWEETTLPTGEADSKMNNPASNFGATPAGGVYEGKPHGSIDDDSATEATTMEQWEMIAAIEQMDAHHFALFSGGVHPDHCHGCGQEWPCRNQQHKRRIIAEIRRLKKLESDHV